MRVNWTGKGDIEAQIWRLGNPSESALWWTGEFWERWIALHRALESAHERT